MNMTIADTNMHMPRELVTILSQSPACTAQRTVLANQWKPGIRSVPLPWLSKSSVRRSRVKPMDEVWSQSAQLQKKKNLPLGSSLHLSGRMLLNSPNYAAVLTKNRTHGSGL